MRKNNKIVIHQQEQTIRKSNDFSLSQLHQGLTLRQTQLLSYAIYCTQQRQNNGFAKHEFEKFFDVIKYPTAHVKKDIKSLLGLGIYVHEFGDGDIIASHIFSRITYVKGKFNFEWGVDILPLILELKERYISVDLSMTSKFSSSYAWVLYEFIKSQYGKHTVQIPKEELLAIFHVEDSPAYKKPHKIKEVILQRAIEDINTFTEYNIAFTEVKQGVQVVAYQLSWSTGKLELGSTNKQLQFLLSQLTAIHNEVKEVYSHLLFPSDAVQETLARAYEIQRECKTQQLTMKQANQYIREIKGILKKVQLQVKEEKSSTLN